jgi:hypothetical protein
MKVWKGVEICQDFERQLDLLICDLVFSISK